MEKNVLTRGACSRSPHMWPLDYGVSVGHKKLWLLAEKLHISQTCGLDHENEDLSILGRSIGKNLNFEKCSFAVLCTWSYPCPRHFLLRLPAFRKPKTQNKFGGGYYCHLNTNP